MTITRRNVSQKNLKENNHFVAAIVPCSFPLPAKQPRNRPDSLQKLYEEITPAYTEINV